MRDQALREIDIDRIKNDQTFFLFLLLLSHQPQKFDFVIRNAIIYDGAVLG